MHHVCCHGMVDWYLSSFSLDKIRTSAQSHDLHFVHESVQQLPLTLSIPTHLRPGEYTSNYSPSTLSVLHWCKLFLEQMQSNVSLLCSQLVRCASSSNNNNPTEEQEDGKGKKLQLTRASKANVASLNHLETSPVPTGQVQSHE